MFLYLFYRAQDEGRGGTTYLLVHHSGRSRLGSAQAVALAQAPWLNSLCWCVLQRRNARLCFAKQSSYELGSLAFHMISSSPVEAGKPPPPIPDMYPLTMHRLLLGLVASDPSTACTGCLRWNE